MLECFNINLEQEEKRFFFFFFKCFSKTHSVDKNTDINFIVGGVFIIT